jgi:hypothetical protein
MTFDFKYIWESKKAFRRKLANRPVAEKLAMLDMLRERALAIRAVAGVMHQPMARETQVEYRSGQKDKDAKKA